MNTNLRKIFNIQIILFIVLILFVSYFILYWISARDVERQTIAEFKSEVSIRAVELNYKGVIAFQNVKALTSRTMIRKKLYDYHKDEISLKELKEYTVSKYIDGVSVYDGIVMARRNYLNDTTVALYNEDNFQIPVNVLRKDYVFFEKDNKIFIYIKNKIIHNSEHIGFDEAVFSLGSQNNQNLILINSFLISDEKTCKKESGKYHYFFNIGKSDYYILAEFDQSILKRQRINILKAITIQSIILIIMVIGISYFTIFRLSFGLMENLEETNRQLSSAISDRELLLKELHHRIKNNLNIILSFLQLQKSRSDNKELIKKNDEVVGKIHAIHKVHEMMQDASDFSRLEIGQYLNELCNRIISTGSYRNVNLKVEQKFKILMQSKYVISIGLIFSELLVNSLKHGFQDKTMNIIIVIEDQNNQLYLSYKDDGHPFPDNFNYQSSSSLGFLVINDLAKSLNADIEFDISKKKFVFKFQTNN